MGSKVCLDLTAVGNGNREIGLCFLYTINLAPNRDWYTQMVKNPPAMQET